ncbi:MAG: hypothetical protein O7D94_06360, partial [Planctomycetota bacterium]|nr:hypothetical protein [Planctomycetota bacterium]
SFPVVQTRQTQAGMSRSMSLASARPMPVGARFGHREGLTLKRGGVARIFGSAGISVAIHVLIVVLLAFTTWAVGANREPVTTEYRAKIVGEPKTLGDAGGFRFSGDARLDIPHSADSDLRPSKPLQDLASLLASDEPIDIPSIQSGGFGPALTAGGELSRSDVIGIGTGGGAGSGAGGLGRRSVAGGGPVGSMWGVGEGQRARSVVYVLDRSGSMVEMFPLLKRELKRSIGSLEDDQRFNVIWFAAGNYVELSQKLLPATFANKRRAFDDINQPIEPAGHTDPTGALRRAFGYKPDVLFLVSDADFAPNNDLVVRTIKERNRRKKTAVNTILMVYDRGGGGQRVEEAIAFLQSIAEDNNGSYKRVTESDAAGD